MRAVRVRTAGSVRHASRHQLFCDVRFFETTCHVAGRMSTWRAECSGGEAIRLGAHATPTGVARGSPRRAYRPAPPRRMRYASPRQSIV